LIQNGFIERFNRSYRQAVLDMYVFQTLNEVREQTETWIKEYNEERPHESLRDLTPREFLLNKKTGNLCSRVVLNPGHLHFESEVFSGSSLGSYEVSYQQLAYII
jgi:hypothetical protein